MANVDIDPSGIMTIRITTARAISGRFDRFMGDLQTLLVTEDALGLTTRPGEMPIGNAASQRWRFLSSPAKLAAFQAWVKERVDAGLLQSDSPDPDKPWLSQYLQSAYLSGLGRSFLDAKAASLLPEQIKELSKAQFLSQALTSPVATDTLKLMYMRNFTQLKGVTDKMSATMSTILADELSKGSGPAKIASRLRKEMGFSKNRAIVIAQTELSYVQSEGQLDGFEAAGMGETVRLKVMVEWLTAASPCSACAAMKGVVLTIKEARGKIPFHPRCRCCWVFVNIYAPATPGQKRSKKAIQKALGDALKASTSRKTVKDARTVSRWQGASLRPTGKRTLKLPTGDAATPPQLPAKDPREVPQGVGYTVNKSLTGRIVKSGSKGVPVAVGGPDIRDQSGLVFTTQGPQGPVTNINLTVTPEGSKKIAKTLGATYETERIKFRPTDAAPEDPHFKPLSSTAAMIDARKGDGKFNEISIASTRDTLQKLKTTLDPKTPAPPVEKGVARHYVKQVEAVLKAKADRVSPPAIDPFRPSRDPKAPTNRSPFPVVKEDLSLPVRTFSDGTGTDTAKHQKLPGESYKIQLPGGVSARFVPTSGRPQNVGNPLQGSLTIQVPGKASEATIKSALNSVASLGVKTKPLTAAQEELEYLHKVIDLRGDSKKPPYGVVRRNILLSDAQKVSKVKEFARTRYQIDLKKAPADYKPQGRPLSADGTGPRVWDRWDLTRDTIKAEMSGYALQYTPGSIPNAVRGILASGGIVTSAAEKVLKGVPLTTGGANLAADATSGAAGYVFTRIRKLDDAAEVSGLFFKPESLARLDAVSLDEAAFNPANPSQQRKTTIAEWVLAASNATNETYFQHGLDLLSDLDFIRAPSTRDALATIKAFMDAGVESLPDGRRIADVVIVKTPSKPKKPRP